MSRIIWKKVKDPMSIINKIKSGNLEYTFKEYQNGECFTYIIDNKEYHLIYGLTDDLPYIEEKIEF